jgi:cysteine-rich repeat protein
MVMGRRIVWWQWLLGVAVVVHAASTAYGHGLALPFAFWGNFSPPAAHCQRLLGAAGARCGLAAIKAHNDCYLALIDGAPCEITAVPDLIQRAHLKQLDFIDRLCTTPEAQALGFLLKFEAQTDLDTFCRTVEATVVSGIYGPLSNGGSIGSPNATQQRCVDATARVAVRLLAYAFRDRRLTLDRIASRPVEPSEKQRELDSSTTRIARFENAVEGAVASRCPDSDFQTVYHRDAATLLHAISQRADCLAGAMYVQSGVVCPAPVCGNGLIEAGEQCDDGNLTNGDGCSSHCTLELTGP